MTRPIFTIILAVALRTIAVSAGPVEIGRQVAAAASAACFEVVVILLLLLEELLLDDATGFCRSYIAVNTTVTKTQTTVIPRTAVSTVPLTTIVTTTAAGGAAPTVTQIVYSNCGLVGYVKETPAYYFDGSGTYGTFDPCSQKCTEDAACVSFAFGSSQCLLFNTTVTTNVNPSASSPFTFYDRRCPGSSVRPRAENEQRDITTRHTLTLPGITLGTPSSAVATTRPPPPPPPPPPPHSTSLSLNISNTTFVSSACSCLVGSGQTHSVTVVQIITRTTQVNVVTSAVVATKVETVFTNTNAVTVTVTTTA